MSDLFFTSDWHIGHEKIIGYCDRPFAGVAEMSSVLVENYNATVGPKDTCWFLGDLAFYDADLAVDVFAQLNGHKHVVWGNHDKDLRNRLAYLFESEQDYKELKHDKQKLILMHYPLLSWNGSKHGSIHLHGHCHGSLAFDPQVKRLDVGVDAHGFFPVSYAQVKETVKDGANHWHH